jgi:hypothetical protein
MRYLYRSLLILIPMFILLANAKGQIVSEKLQKGKWLQSWLLCGPFPNKLAEGVTEYHHDKTTLGFYVDHLHEIGGETKVKPRNGLDVKSENGHKVSWKLYNAPNDYIDLISVYEQDQRVVAYGACEIISDSDQEVVLTLGSNDGIRAWLNGILVWDHHLPRGAERDHDWVKVILKKGKNLLLLKIDQGTGKWGFYARFLDLEEQRRVINDLRPNMIEAKVEAEIYQNKISLVMGRNARYRIMEEVPEYIASIRGVEGDMGLKSSALLADTIVLDIAHLKTGPYWIDCSASLPRDQKMVESLFFYRGESPHRIRTYDENGNVKSFHVEMLNDTFNPVPDGIREDNTGIYSILRPDVSPFYLRFLVKSSSLGYRWFFADNEGRGFTVPPDGKISIDLPMESAKTLQNKMQSSLSGKIPTWIKDNIQKRLSQNDSDSPAHIYQLLDQLSTIKSQIRSNKSLSLWYAPGTEKVAPGETVPNCIMDTVHLSLAKNEYEPFQLVLRPKHDIDDLNIEFKSLTSNSEAFDQSNINILQVEYIVIETTSDLYGTKGPWPDPLPPVQEQISITKDKNNPFWITFFASKGQQAGMYNGEIHISSKAFSKMVIPIQVEIYDFILPDEPAIETAYGVYVNKNYHGPVTDEQYMKIHDLYMQFCASHRISPYSPHAGAGIDIQFEGNPAKPRIDYTKFDKAMERYLDKFHFTSFRVGRIPNKLNGFEIYSEEYDRLFKLTYSEIQEHLRKKGWLRKAFWYWIDEPPISEYPNVKKGMSLLKSACPDMRRLLTCNNEDAPIAYFYDYVNLWVPIMDRFNQKKSSQRQKLGEDVWWYVCTGPKGPYPNNFTDHPAMNHRVRFWMIDKFGLDGSLYWSVTYWKQNPWELAMSYNPQGGMWGNGDGRLLYPPRRTEPDVPVIEGPVTSIRFENLRDGMEDIEYLHLLKKSGFKGQGLLSKAQNELVQTMTVFEQNPFILMAMRHRVAKAIE